jgi:hypothetical protein
MNEREREFLEYASQGQVNEIIQCLEQEPSLCNIKVVSQQFNDKENFHYRLRIRRSEVCCGLQYNVVELHEMMK